MRPALIGLSLVTLFVHRAIGQATGPAFETADVRISGRDTKEGGGFMPEGLLEYRGATMLKLIGTAYSVKTDWVLGGPDWVASDRFDVAAKAASPQASPADLREMLQALLADRFALAVHDEQKDMPVYLLAVGRNGPKLQPAAGAKASDCPAVDGEAGLNHRACAAYTMTDLSILLPQIARNYVDRPVVDTTGLEGAYDFHLDWMSKANYLDAKAVGRPTESMFDAIDKLGLTLEPGMRPTQVIVIDRVNRTPVEKSPTVAPEFDVADVRRSKTQPGQQGLRAFPGGQLEIRGYTLRELIKLAFEVKDDRVTGGPKWLDADRFDVIAKSPDVMSPRAMSAMLKTLIVRRFKLETHSMDQPAPAFALVLGSRSPKLQDTSGSARSECKLTLAQKGRAYVCQNTTMAQLVERLPSVTQAYLIHPLVDLTGLTGAYDFTLTWTPKSRLPAVTPPAQAAMPEASTPDGDLTVFEAIDKQLGLKIEERKLPMPVIVIDHVLRTPEDR